jgi:hypothetical protein
VVRLTLAVETAGAFAVLRAAVVVRFDAVFVFVAAGAAAVLTRLRATKTKTHDSDFLFTGPSAEKGCPRRKRWLILRQQTSDRKGIIGTSASDPQGEDEPVDLCPTQVLCHNPPRERP